LRKNKEIRERPLLQYWRENWNLFKGGVMAKSEAKKETEASSLVEQIGVVFVGVIPAFMFIAGCCVGGYNFYSRLKHGDCPPVPASALLNEVLPERFFAWVADNSSWIGLKKHLNGIIGGSLAWFLVILALCWFLIASFVFDRIQDEVIKTKMYFSQKDKTKDK